MRTGELNAGQENADHAAVTAHHAHALRGGIGTRDCALGENGAQHGAGRAEAGCSGELDEPKALEKLLEILRASAAIYNKVA